MVCRLSAGGFFSSSSRPADIAARYSSASGLKVANSRFSNASALVFIMVSAEFRKNSRHFLADRFKALNFVLAHQLFEPHSQFVEVARGGFRLPRAVGCLNTGFLDVLHRQSQLIHPGRLLLAD